MLSRPVSIALSAAALLTLSAADTRAALLTDKTLVVEYRFPDANTVLFSDQVVVGSGVELTAVSGLFDVDVADQSVTFAFTEFANGTFSGPAQGVSFNGPVLVDVSSSIGPFGSVSIHPSTNLAGFDASFVFFDADRIFVNFAGLAFTPDTLVRVDIAPAAIPEPTLLPLTVIVLLCLLPAGRRRAGRQTMTVCKRSRSRQARHALGLRARRRYVTAADLDRAAPDHPVYLTHTTGRDCFLIATQDQSLSDLLTAGPCRISALWAP